MAAVGDCFSIGSTVACKTCFDQTIEGEVLAFDQQTKMLILKCRAKNAEKMSDVYFLNLQFCSDVQVKKEVCAITDSPQPLNINRLRTRLRNTVEQRKRWVSAIAAGVSPEGQNLYMALAKTLGQVTWSGPDIVILNEVTISPPYKIENVAVTAANSDKANSLTFVKKVVDQFYKTQATTNVAGSSTSTNAIASTVGTSSNNASASPVPAN